MRARESLRGLIFVFMYGVVFYFAAKLHVRGRLKLVVLNQNGVFSSTTIGEVVKFEHFLFTPFPLIHFLIMAAEYFLEGDL
jgi:hypothetical protein